MSTLWSIAALTPVIVDIYCGEVGLKSDGTLEIAKSYNYARDVEKWTNIRVPE